VNRLADRAGLPVALSMGMGKDSAAVAARWLTDPASRDFPLSDLTVVTAMTGDEPDVTRRLMEDHLLPLMRRTRTRFVQIARAEQAGARYVVLDDSRCPQKMIMAGPWRLSDELRASGTVPQVAARRRLCSWRAKGSVLDAWYADEYGNAPFRHVVCFAAEEARRAERDQNYATAARRPEYPLIDTWNWDRVRCDLFLVEMFGEPWSRSACGYCPFSAGKEGRAELIERWRAEPEIGAQALSLEYTALALNPRSRLYGTRSARDLVRVHDLSDVENLFTRGLNREKWAVYEVRRIIHARKADPSAKGPAWRSVRTLATGTRHEAEHALYTAARTHRARPFVDEHGIVRAEIIARAETYPTLEHGLALAPVGVDDKQRPRFEDWWTHLHTPTTRAKAKRAKKRPMSLAA
jgi:hypothetical protein